MKKIIFSITLSLIGVTLFGQHQIEVTKLFEKNALTSEVLLQFNLDQSLSETELVSITQLINDNNQIIKFAQNGTAVELTVKLSSFERSVYQKAFMMMNISDVKLSDGKSISIEEFLSKNNL
jgi:hypothetical protein